ncbi:DUF924 family protein [Thalassotalea atypica]|uniref:DUF924 family protein n=1 Tax=Thalassotalea atypica TaxID=2054316 RepID=UPI00257465F5|nr:DUF924 family protein [Thalassotalea atypica]
MTYTDIIKFWFEELSPEQWWTKDHALDQLIKHRFQKIHQQAMHCELYLWRETAKGRLAEIIILDQFSRNMFRNTPQAFASDNIALSLAQEAINIGADQSLTEVERSFLYTPFMHSESLLIHDVAMMLYQKNGIESNFAFEKAHRDIIAKFGRYPHRNVLLERKSTPEELEFLSQPNSSF